jgi:WXG100 family type VII secretion target
MSDHLKVDADAVFNTSHVVSNDAEELREELSRLSHEWDNVSHGWSGVAASAFTQIWEEWHEGAAKIVETLAESSHRLATAAVLYEARDASSAQALDSAGDGIGL